MYPLQSLIVQYLYSTCMYRTYLPVQILYFNPFAYVILFETVCINRIPAYRYGQSTGEEMLSIRQGLVHADMDSMRNSANAYIIPKGSTTI